MSDILLMELIIACQAILYLQSFHLQLHLTQLLCDVLCLLEVVLAVEGGNEYLECCALLVTRGLAVVKTCQNTVAVQQSYKQFTCAVCVYF